LASLLPAGNPVLAEEAAAVRVETVRFPGGGQVRVVRGPAVGGQAKAAPAPAVPRPERAIAAGSGVLWLVGDDRLTACWVRRTSYVNGYRIRCLGYRGPAFRTPAGRPSVTARQRTLVFREPRARGLKLHLPVDTLGTFLRCAARTTAGGDDRATVAGPARRF
jgi:hypothetical protein